jgi:hypothetical protein
MPTSGIIQWSLLIVSRAHNAQDKGYCTLPVQTTLIRLASSLFIGLGTLLTILEEAYYQDNRPWHPSEMLAVLRSQHFQRSDLHYWRSHLWLSNPLIALLQAIIHTIVQRSNDLRSKRKPNTDGNVVKPTCPHTLMIAINP